MKIDRITLRKGITINLGDYENIRLEVSFEAEVTDGELEDGAMLELSESADLELALALWDTVWARKEHLVEAVASEAHIERIERSVKNDSAWNWMYKLNPAPAEGLLLEMLTTARKKLDERLAEAEAQRGDDQDAPVVPAGDTPKGGSDIPF